MSNLPSRFIYLHGFCSGPQSAKAKYFYQRFQSLSYPLSLPDLNQPDFATLTLSRQIQQVQTLILETASSVTLIGSSLGGLTAALVAERLPQVDRLVLLAPAFDFLNHWLPQMSPQALQEWQATGQMCLYHYGEQRQRALHYEFLTDAQQPSYRMESLHRSLPTLILHGTQDEVIPLESSQRYAQSRPWVTFMPLESDHSLASVISVLWRETRDFLGLA